jgi:hypothetical protein
MRVRLHSSHLEEPSRLVQPEEEDAAAAAAAPPSDTVIDFFGPVEQGFRSVARITAPELSVPFLLGFVAVAYFHESYFRETALILGAWLVIQLTAHTLNDDFKTQLFWSIFSLCGHVIFYLFCGSLWSGAKVYLDLWQKHMDPYWVDRIRQCTHGVVAVGANASATAAAADAADAPCVGPLLFDMKWMMVRWMTTWPVSMAYTLTRDPLNILTDLIYRSLRHRYFTIMVSGLAALDSENQHVAPASWTGILTIFAYIFGYLAIGYAWTHVKLFFEIWQGALPASLDAQVRDVYARKSSYWEFVMQIKWHVTMWMLTWPISMVYTVLRHPLRILADFIYQLSVRKYVWIVSKAMDIRMKQD